MENEFGKEVLNIEELQKELKAAEQIAAEIVELNQLQRKFLEVHNQQQWLDVLNTWELKLHEDCELFNNVSSFLDRPTPIYFGDEVDASCLYVQVGRANLIDYVQTRLEFSDSSSIHL